MQQLLSDIALIPDAKRRGETFERVVKRLLENAPEFRNQFKEVWLWSEYPDAKGRDLGWPPPRRDRSPRTEAPKRVSVR